MTHDGERGGPTGRGSEARRHDGSPLGPSATVRVVAALAVGIAVGGPVSVLFHGSSGCSSAGWRQQRCSPSGCGSPSCRWSAQETAVHSVREDTGRATSDALVVIAAVASLAADAAPARSRFGRAPQGPVGSPQRGQRRTGVGDGAHPLHDQVCQAVLHRSGRRHRVQRASPPRYTDFAYVAFTIGMTYQVSDTTLRTRDPPHRACGTPCCPTCSASVIIATTINLVAGLGK